MIRLPSVRLHRTVLIADLAATALFGAEGAASAVTGQLDLLGIGVLAIVTALGGGILRDVLLGATPPAAFRDQRYVISALGGAAVMLLIPAAMRPTGSLILLLLDAAGLAFSTVGGAQKSLDLGSRPLTAAMLAMVTATGGGMARDLLLAQVPRVLRADFYATAALAGAAVLMLALRFRIPGLAAAYCGGVSCFLLRVAGALMHWRLPHAG